METIEGSRLRKTFKLCLYLDAGDMPMLGRSCCTECCGCREVDGDCGGVEASLKEWWDEYES